MNSASAAVGALRLCRLRGGVLGGGTFVAVAAGAAPVPPRGELVRLPWDYQYYGLSGDEQDVVAAVRASMSIPFFFDPVTVQASEADVDVQTPDGSLIRQHYEAGTVTWVDGGMLRNFPIHAFDRADGVPRDAGQARQFLLARRQPPAAEPPAA